MSALGAPLEIAQAVARHVAPIAGILFLGWSARNVLLLYFTDTLFAIAVMMAGLLRHFSPPVADDGWAARLNGEVGVIGGGLFIAAIFVLTLGFPLVFMLGGFDVWKTLADPALSLDNIGVIPPHTIRHRVIMPVSGVHQGTLAALRYARMLSDDITAVHINVEPAEAEKVRQKWETWGQGVRVVMLNSAYRLFIEPLLEYISERFTAPSVW